MKTFKYLYKKLFFHETQLSPLEEKKADEMEVAAQAHEKRKAQEKEAKVIKQHKK